MEVGALVVPHVDAPAHPVKLGVQQQRVHRPLLRRGQRQPGVRQQAPGAQQKPLSCLLRLRPIMQPLGTPQRRSPPAPAGTSRLPPQRPLPRQ